MANIFRKIYIKFYQNQSGYTEDMAETVWHVFRFTVYNVSTRQCRRGALETGCERLTTLNAAKASRQSSVALISVAAAATADVDGLSLRLHSSLASFFKCYNVDIKCSLSNSLCSYHSCSPCYYVIDKIGVSQ